MKSPRVTRRKKVKPDDPEQSRRFVEKAKSLGCADITEEEFEKAFAKVSKPVLPEN